MKIITTVFFTLVAGAAMAQVLSPEAYKEMKAKKLGQKSPFEQIADREVKANIVYENNDVLAFATLISQAPVHCLIFPKKRINTLNDATDADALVLGKMILAAKEVAKKFGIAETGYRITINTNRDAGQTEFHICMHLLGGEYLGPNRGPKSEK